MKRMKSEKEVKKWVENMKLIVVDEELRKQYTVKAENKTVKQKSIRIGKTMKQILEVLDEHRELRRVEIEKAVNRRIFQFGAKPLERLLIAGCIERINRGKYAITERGRLVLQHIHHTNNSVIIPRCMFRQHWLEYFKERTW